MIREYFEFEKYNTSYYKEIIAGLTTFATMSYIIFVNPAILESAGIPKDASMVATIISAVFGTLLMGVYAKRPFAIAPYMGENAFIAYTVVKTLGYSWQTALGAIFIGGLVFALLTIFKIRSWLTKSLPQSLKCSFAVGIGIFIMLIGLVDAGIVTVGVPSAPLRLGNLLDIKILFSILGFLLITIMMIKKVPGAILIGILVVAFASMMMGITPIPQSFISMPPSISATFLQLDIVGALSWGFINVIMVVFIMDFVDTMGTLIGLSYRAKLLDDNGNLPDIEKPMLADAIATVVGALVGTTTTGAYIESAAGIESGGKSGFTAVVVALLFAISLFFAPLVTSIPAHAYAPALMMVGIFMLEPIKHIDFSDYTEFIPASATIFMMSFTYNLGIGMTSGFIFYTLLKVLTGRYREVHPGMWMLFTLSVVYYIFNLH